MTDYNNIGISDKLDLKRVKKLLSIGVFASLLHLTGDLILGWGVENEAYTGFLRMLTAYTEASDGGIFAAALLGLFGTALEGFCMFGIYRLMTERAKSYAHAYRSGIFGYLIFCPCGFHVPVCALAYLMKHGLEQSVALEFYSKFIMPSFALFWIFFIVLQIAQIKAFAKGLTPYPKYCALFSMPIGMLAAMSVRLFGNVAWANAISCAWISIGCLWMFLGLLLSMKKIRVNSDC